MIVNAPMGFAGLILVLIAIAGRLRMPGISEQCPNPGRREACLTQCPQCDRLIALGEFVPVLVQDQAVMGIGRRGKIQQRLQQPLDMSGGQQIFAARHQIDALERIIHHHRQMIGGRHVLARQHHVAEQKRLDGAELAMLDESERPGHLSRLGRIEPQGIRLAPRQARAALRLADRCRQVPG